jgi:hypothetical protein
LPGFFVFYTLVTTLQARVDDNESQSRLPGFLFSTMENEQFKMISVKPESQSRLPGFFTPDSYLEYCAGAS